MVLTYNNAGSNSIQQGQKPPSSRPKIQRSQKKHFPRGVRQVLCQWVDEHLTHRYPSATDKFELSEWTGLTKKQIEQFFINARRRYIKTRNGKF